MKYASKRKQHPDLVRRGKWLKPLIATALASGLTGCVKVSAPDRPIEINLNINITQEVVVRLQEDVQQLRQRDPGAF